MVKYYKLTACTLFLLVFICMVFLCVLIGCKPRNVSKTRASQTFRQYVLDPIPKSVTNIKADQPGKILGYVYTFRFNISIEDLSLLINSGSFIRIWNVKYKNGCIDWGWDRSGPLGIAKFGHSMPLYGDVWDLPREPTWFKPGIWENPKAYGFFKAGNLVNIQAIEREWRNLGGWVTVKVLLYNEREGEAYFIVSRREN